MFRFLKRIGSAEEIKWMGVECAVSGPVFSAVIDMILHGQQVCSFGRCFFWKNHFFYTFRTFWRISLGLTTNQRQMIRARYSSVNAPSVIIQPEDKTGSV